jgi:serine/threonine-protein kinase
MPLTIGSRLGPYEIQSALGAGGMGEVYRAHDTKLGRDVAVKMLPESFVDDPERVARFRREAQILAALNHPNIAQIYGFEESDGVRALVMELVEGPTLADRIARGPIPIDEALPIAKQIAEALDAAHQRGIIHRDLKPANIKVRPDGTVKILDFGLAKLQAISAADAPTAVGTTSPGILLGTAAYMAPEQARGGATDARSDIFSFGAVLHEMLSGKRPFGGDFLADVLTAVIRDEPAPLDSPASAVVTRCLAKRPAERYQSMAELKNALEAVTLKPVASQSPSIAVLPFANMSRDPDTDYFSDGLAEEIINLLAQTPGLKVIARTSSFAFRGKEQDITKIAEALRVATILEGSVRRSGNRVRVTAQLIAAGDGSHLFSERYEREMADVFAMQDEIAAAVTAALRVKLSVPPAARRPYTPRLAAYEAVLKARHLLEQLAPDSFAKGRDYLAEAIALDSGYAVAHVELGRNYTVMATLPGLMSAHDATPLAREEARKAIALDPLLPDALALLGHIAARYEYDWREAERLLDAARAHAPVAPETRAIYGIFLLSVGRHEEAIEETRRAVSDDPLNLRYNVALMMALQNARQFSTAASHGRRCLEFDEGAGLIWFVLSLGSMLQGDLADATAAAERAFALMPWNALLQAQHAGLLARRGDESAANRFLETLGDGHAYGAPAAFVTYFLARADNDHAADWAAQAIDQRWPQIVPMLREYAPNLRRSPRWPELMKMVNLPDVG